MSRPEPRSEIIARRTMFAVPIGLTILLVLAIYHEYGWWGLFGAAAIAVQAVLVVGFVVWFVMTLIKEGP